MLITTTHLRRDAAATAGRRGTRRAAGGDRPAVGLGGTLNRVVDHQTAYGYAETVVQDRIPPPACRRGALRPPAPDRGLDPVANSKPNRSACSAISRRAWPLCSSGQLVGVGLDDHAGVGVEHQREHRARSPRPAATYPSGRRRQDVAPIRVADRVGKHVDDQRGGRRDREAGHHAAWPARQGWPGAAGTGPRINAATSIRVVAGLTVRVAVTGSSSPRGVPVRRGHRLRGPRAACRVRRNGTRSLSRSDHVSSKHTNPVPVDSPSSGRRVDSKHPNSSVCCAEA